MLIFSFVIFAYSQGIERPRKIVHFKTPTLACRGIVQASATDTTKGIVQDSATDTTKGVGAELFKQLTLDIENKSPQVCVKAIKLYAQLGEKKVVDFYVLTTIPLLSKY